MRRSIFLWALLCLALPLRAPAAARAGDYIGINQWVDDWDNVTMGGVDTAKVARWIRWYTYMDWCTTEPGKFQFAPTYVGGFNFDDWFKTWKQAGLKVNLCMVQSPKYASSYQSRGNHGKDPYHYPPFGSSDGLSPKDYQAYADWCQRMAARYGRSGSRLVDAMEIWNEPNLTDPGWGAWRSDTCKPVGGKSWCETEARQYAAMLKASTGAVRRADPAMRVSAGVTAGWDEEYFDLLHAQGALQGAEGLNFHCYFGVPNSVGPGHAPEYQHGLRETCKKAVAWRDRKAPGKALWMTELGYDAYDRVKRPPVAFGATLAEQANYLVRAYVIAAPYVDHFFWFIASDATHGPAAVQFENCGIVRKYGTKNPGGDPAVSPKPAYWAMAFMNRTIGGLDYQATLADDDQGVYAYFFKDPLAPKGVIVAWCARSDQRTDTGHSVTYALSLPPRASALAVRRSREGLYEGERESLRGSGKLSLRLSEMPLYVELKLD